MSAILRYLSKTFSSLRGVRFVHMVKITFYNVSKATLSSSKTDQIFGRGF